MDKMKFESADITAQNIEKIAELFPNCITETKDENGNLKKAINFDLLKQDLSKDIVDGKECYEFTWVGKKKSIIEANKPIRKTLRPCKEDSVNWDTTENLYIEGDNLEVLKLLQGSYLGKVKMIYIDPPYNTGNDFIYNDDFKIFQDEYENESGIIDDLGNRFVKNTDTNGRFHSDWCSMIYSRLLLARNLLSDDGVMFISIGDDEDANLIKICDEIFGRKNFIANICHKHRASISNDRIISENHNYVAFYAKDIEIVFANHKRIGDDPILDGFNKEDEKGQYKLAPVDGPGGAKKGNPHYEFMGIDGYWRYSKETMQKLYDEDMLVITQGNIQKKYYLSQAKESRKTVTTWWDDNFLTSTATSILQKLMGVKAFDNPKNTNLILKMLKMITHFDTDSIILDFFSGSATTAHAVMQLNAEDGGNRKFIMVQLPESCDEKSEAFKAGYKNICEIGKERIRRAAKKIAEDNPNSKFDGGFRVFKVDESNMKDVYYAPADYSQDLLDALESNIKEDRTDLDLFFGCILDWGNLLLNLSYTSETIENCAVHTYSDNVLIACFNDNIPESVIKEIAKRKPRGVVFRDSSFADTPSKINATEIFNLLSPNTTVKVI